MKQLISLLIIGCLSGLPAFSQDVTGWDDNALRRHLERPGNDEKLKVNVWNELAFRLMTEKKDTAKLFAGNALALATDRGYLEGQAAAWNLLGNLAKYSADYDGAKQAFSNALELRKKDKNKAGVASCYNNLGLLYKDRQSEYDTAEAYFSMGLEEIGDSKIGIAGTLHNNLGDVLTRMGKYDAAFLHLEKSIVIWKELKSLDDEAWSKLNLAVLFQELKDYPKSDALLDECLPVFEKAQKPEGQGKCRLLSGNNAFYRDEFHKALDLYERALAFRDNLNQNDIAIIFRNRGSCFFRLGRSEMALENYLFAREVFEKTENAGEIAALDFDIGNIYYDQSQNELALQYFEQCLKRLESIGNPALKSQALFYLSATGRRLGRYDLSLDYNNRYIQLKDSLNNLSQEAFRLARESEELRREKVEAQNKKMVIYGAAGFLILWLLLTVVVLFAYNQQKKKKIAEQEVDELLQLQELKLLNARQDAQEAERDRIAHDLHDGLGSLLTTIKVYFSELSSKISEVQKEVREQYQTTNKLLDEAFNSVRRIAHNMRSGTLAEFGLKAALESLKGDIEGTKRLSVELATFGLEERLDGKLEYEIYKIIQELTGNTLKHAGASKLSIQVNRFDDMVNVMVEDNGVGFDPEKARLKDGMGLGSIRARVGDIGGTMSIDSRKGRGTTVVVDVGLGRTLGG